MSARRIVILGAAGRDFHDFNVLYRGHPDVEVVAFTAAQIPDIAGRAYPASLAGPGYPNGIPIVPEDELPTLLRREKIDEVVLAYSDLPHLEVMHKASIALAGGASFLLPGPNDTMLRSTKPVISICAVRTGAGKSPLTRYVSRYLRAHGRRVAVVRHPMPYGNLAEQAVQRFATMEDLDAAHCTIEEREEYEPHLREGVVVFAGVDYEPILRAAEREADVVLWDGGNNDLPFYRPDLSFVVADPHRAGHELSYHPGEANFRSADVIVIGKTDSAPPQGIQEIERSAKDANPAALLVRGALRITAEDPERLRGRRAIVVEDGPTVTHGGLSFGAGLLLAEKYGAKVEDARRSAVGSIARVYDQYPHLTRVLPAMGYGAGQVADLEATINRSAAEFVIDGSPVNLQHLLKVRATIVPVRYEYDDIGGAVEKVLERFSGVPEEAGKRRPSARAPRKAKG